MQDDLPLKAHYIALIEIWLGFTIFSRASDVSFHIRSFYNLFFELCKFLCIFKKKSYVAQEIYVNMETKSSNIHYFNY